MKSWQPVRMAKKLNLLKNNFAVTSHHFVEPLVTLCFGLHLTLPTGVKARVNPSLHVMILRVNSECQGLVPILHLSMVMLPLE